ncbi:MAG: C40 family peptidase [Gemmatimonadota bacterium]|nr:C40 family peptidase [Gemmatimonadota bacterium]
MNKTPILIGFLAGALLLGGPQPVSGQTPKFDFSFGFWRRADRTAQVLSASYYKPFIGPLQVGFGLTHLKDVGVVEDRTHTGGQLTLLAGRGRGFYGIGTGALSIEHSGGDLDATWSGGVGYATNLLGFLSLGIESRYRLERDDPAGLPWFYDPGSDRWGWQFEVRVGFGIPRRNYRIPRPARGGWTGNNPPRGGSPGNSRWPSGTKPPPASGTTPTNNTNGNVSSSEAVRITSGIVQTAMGELGRPYVWGGTGENGFDCSGLIQYSYGEHGIIIPRVSRDQARHGSPVPKDLDRLQPGDILTFGAEPGSFRVTHVGMYIGDGVFIHSSSRGVTTSNFRSDDGTSRWWRERWLGARRIIN